MCVCVCELHPNLKMSVFYQPALMFRVTVQASEVLSWLSLPPFFQYQWNWNTVPSHFVLFGERGKVLLSLRTKTGLRFFICFLLSFNEQIFICLSSPPFFSPEIVFGLFWVFIDRQLKIWTGIGGEREGEWHAANGRGWNRTQGRCSEDMSSVYGVLALPNELPGTPCLLPL